MGFDEEELEITDAFEADQLKSIPDTEIEFAKFWDYAAISMMNIHH